MNRYTPFLLIAAICALAFAVISIGLWEEAASIIQKP